VAQAIAAEKNAPLYRLGRDFRIRRKLPDVFSYYGLKHNWHNLTTALQGSHQAENAALVLAACELIGERRANLDFADIKKGLSTTRWPGRLETVSNKPLIILDGAHNLAAARNLARFMASNLAAHDITMVMGILDDKPYKEMLKSLLPLAHRLVLTRAKIDRALDPRRLHEVAQRYGLESIIIPDVAQAVRYAVKTARPADAICIAGSLYVVGEAKEAFDKGLLGKLDISGR
jgi:dihydrofolate synthase/folylpolyglutamate synthase